MAHSENFESQFELGRLYCDRGDFSLALRNLIKASEGYLKEKDFTNYLECINKALRIYADREQFDEINEIKEKIQDLVIREGLQLSPKTYYTFGLCASFKQQYEVALDYLQKSLSLALSEDSKKDVCYAINGIAIVYYNLGRFDEALNEVYNLQVFFQVLKLPELEMSTQMINGHILRQMKRYDQALDIFWKCYDQLREDKNFMHYVYLLWALGLTYFEAGDKNMARTYLDLARRSCDPSNLKSSLTNIEKALKEIGTVNESQYDLVFDERTNSIVEKRLGRVNFKNQFVLLDMLRLFVKNPGQIYSKECLVEKIWKQTYDPAVHDNKIYVTIKRLRKMVEPDFEKPKYIFRAKSGYYMNKNARVMFEA